MKIEIGLLGTGCVGTGVIKILREKSETIHERTGIDISLKRILHRSKKPAAFLGIPEGALTKDYRDIVGDPDMHIVVELIGGYEPAHEIITAALKNGKSVVTANKAIIAKHLVEFNQLAREHGANLEFEGAVAGCIPILNSIKTSFVADNIHSIYAILNGTTNYILTRMSEGASFQKALKLAQEKGFAEADLSFDLKGKDSAQKITIMAMLLFNTAVPDNVHTEGISRITTEDLTYAYDLGYIIKLIAAAKRYGNEIEIGVQPTLIPEKSALAHVRDETNAVYLKSDYIGDALLYGKGAGELPTASIVVSDIVRIATRLKNGVSRPPVSIFEQTSLVDPLETESRFYIRYGVLDKVGILARIAKVLGDHNVSIAGVWQKKTVRSVVSLVMTTHKARVKDVLDSVKIIDSSTDLVRGKSLPIRIDDLRG